MSTKSRRALSGIHVPTITIFKDTKAQEVDVEANQKHILYLAQAGIQGVLIQGSTGEQVALTREERKEVWLLYPLPVEALNLMGRDIAHEGHSGNRRETWIPRLYYHGWCRGAKHAGSHYVV